MRHCARNTILVGCWLVLAVSPARPLALAAETAAGAALFKQINATTYRYTIDLKDTGTTNLGTLWYSWTLQPDKDYLPVSPTNIVSPSGWSAVVTHLGAGDGFAVRWVASSNALTPGQTLGGFGFDIQQTPAQLSSDPQTASFVYQGAPFSDAGFQFTIAPTSAPWQNPFSHFDVDVNGLISPLDAKQVVDDLIANGPHSLSTPTLTSAPPAFLDVNGDNFVSPTDALLVVDALIAGTPAVATAAVEPVLSPAIFAAPMAVPEPATMVSAASGAATILLMTLVRRARLGRGGRQRALP